MTQEIVIEEQNKDVIEGLPDYEKVDILEAEGLEDK